MNSRACILALTMTFATMIASSSNAGTASCRHHHFDIVPHFDVAPVARGYYLRQILTCAIRHPDENPYTYQYVEDPYHAAPRPYPDIASAVRVARSFYGPTVQRRVPHRQFYPDGTAWQAGFWADAPQTEYGDTPVYRYAARQAERPGVPQVKYNASGLSIDVLSPSLMDVALIGFGATPLGRATRGIGYIFK